MLNENNKNKNLRGVYTRINRSRMRSQQTGQVMFLTVMILGAVITSVTLIGGFLMSNQIRRSAEVTDSAKAIFAADAGVECMLYHLFAQDEWWQAERRCGTGPAAAVQLGNGAKFWISVSSRHASIQRVESGITYRFPRVFTATGQFGQAVRSVEMTLPLF